jgi:penicillin-binding protein 1A
VGVAAGTVHAVSAAFSPGCVSDTPCVPLSRLLEGAPLPEAIHVLDGQRRRLADVAGPARWSLTHDEIPPLVADAFVAVEDKRFRDHDGVDLRGVGRALFRNVTSGRIEEGASTIPMQLVRTLWGESLRDVGPWRRKVIEARTAPRLIGKLGHDRVLTLYLNAIYVGNGLYGVEEASRYYFGVSVGALDLSQVATLVGMTRSPEFYEPRRHPDRARARRDVVLDLLAQEGVVSAADAAHAKAQPLETAPEGVLPDVRSHLTASVTRELRARAPELAGRPGLRVVTSIDSVIQEAGVRALQQQLSAIEAGAYGTFRADSAHPLEGAVVAVDPYSGAVRAWVGGRDFGRSEFDRVAQARRQVGSLIKPFIVATSMEHDIGILALVSTLGHDPDEDSLFDTSEPGGPVPGDGVEDASYPEDWMPEDHVDDPVLPVREALIRSSNRAAVNLGVALGVDAVREVGRDTGIESPIPDVPSAFIGAFEASLLEMTTAYATFGNGGVRVAAFLIQSVEGPDGGVLWEREAPLPVQALDPATSYVVLDALRAVVDRGTAASIRTSGFTGAAAGKTGTTNEGKDAWFIGLVPGLVAGVWIGFDRPRPVVPGGNGGSLAAPVWARWMSSVADSLGPADASWAAPPGVHPVRYDPLSGEIASIGCMTGLARDYAVAYVRDSEYSEGGCAGALGHWLKSLWRSIVPGTTPEVIRPKRRGGGH